MAASNRCVIDNKD